MMRVRVRSPAGSVTSTPVRRVSADVPRSLDHAFVDSRSRAFAELLVSRAVSIKDESQSDPLALRNVMVHRKAHTFILSLMCSSLSWKC